MTKILEFIKDGYQKGDAVRVKCSLGIREGIIESISEDENRIKIRPFKQGKKPLSIIGDNIEELEEIDIPSAQEQPTSSSIITPASYADENNSIDGETENEKDSINDEQETVLEQSAVKNTNSSSQIENKLDSEEFIANNSTKTEISVGSIKLTSLGKMDLSTIPTTRKEQERRKNALLSKSDNTTSTHVTTEIAKTEYPENQDIDKNCDSLKENKEDAQDTITQPKRSFRNIYEKALVEQPISHIDETYKAILRAYSSDENSSQVYAVGFISKSLNNGCGYVWDQNLHKEIWYFADAFCDEELRKISEKEGIHVVYTKRSNRQGDFAVGITLPHTIAQMLAMADCMSDNIPTQQQAREIIENILSQYQHNEDALELLKRISVNTKKNPRKGETTKLNITEITALAKEKTLSEVIPLPQQRPDSPLILSDNTIINTLPFNKRNLSEIECRDIEKELDLMIRSGKREECLKKSYEVLSEACPTPKYLRSYLDRMVNTEIALGNKDNAIKCLAQLLYFNQIQGDAKENTLGHLYMTLGRLYNDLGNKEEAIKALDMAAWFSPSNVTITNYRNLIVQSTSTTNVTTTINSTSINDEEITAYSETTISKMLQQDVDQRVKELNPEDVANYRSLYDRAIRASKDTKKSFELKAQLFLDAAAAFKLMSNENTKGYKLSVANFARMKGNAMYTSISSSLSQFPETRDYLLACANSAQSYFIEALNIYNDLDQKRYLQEILLKYLKLERLISQIVGGKTPDPDWMSGTLKAKLREILYGENIEDQKVFFRTCIAIGASSENSWNTLSGSPDGLMSMFSAFRDDERLRQKCHHLINSLENANIDCKLSSGTFLKKVIQHRQQRVKDFNVLIGQLLKWTFDPFTITEFAGDWKNVENYQDLLLSTEIALYHDVSKVITILSPYSDRLQNERSNFLDDAQQILLKDIESVRNTTTYYGRLFFYNLATKWENAIKAKKLLLRAATLPKLAVSAESRVIKTDKDQKYINFIVTNDGESTADSYLINIKIGDYQKEIKSKGALASDNFDSYTWSIPKSLHDKEHIVISFAVTAYYGGSEVNPIYRSVTFEKEDATPIEAKDIPWKLDRKETSQIKTIFKGRKNDIDKLIRHYQSPDRSWTKIMYGLTRTGKTWLMDFLRQEIKDKTLTDNNEVKFIPFSWDFSKVEDDESKEVPFWENLVATNIYEVLPEELQDKFDKTYKNGLPEEWSKSDFLKIIDFLNNESYMPFITIDEFSNVKEYFEDGELRRLLNASFLSTLRDLALEGKACFIYAGTYDIKELPRNPKYGLTGQLNNTQELQLNAISEQDADELIDVWLALHFGSKAKELIRRLSGCIPYWIQWICLNCGRYAAHHGYHWLDFDEVEDIAAILTGEKDGDPQIDWILLKKMSFQNNQFTPDADAEHALFTSIAYINRDKKHARGVSSEELEMLWTKYNVSTDFQKEMLREIENLCEKKVLEKYQDETRQVYRFYVDLFRRWWYINNRDLTVSFAH